MREEGEYWVKRLNGYEGYGMGVGGLPKIKNPWKSFTETYHLVN